MKLGILLGFAITLLAVVNVLGQKGPVPRDAWTEGCCLISPSSFAPPKHLNNDPVPVALVAKALNCLEENFTEGEGYPSDVKQRYRAWYGKYKSDKETLDLMIPTIQPNRWILIEATYNDQAGIVVNQYTQVWIWKNSWVLGEIQGGAWSFTRLFYVSQHLKLQPKEVMSLELIRKSQPNHCSIDSHQQW